ncbi:MAG: hypothetical protein ACK4FB_04015 [Brevundimonas sp.]|uniref:hypothetical protein n=1 Tax=Brevundimonas sp. TaxID=1871086 RepID=UPI00391D0EE3
MVLALGIGVVTVAGFGLHAVTGRVVWASFPPLVHIHALGFLAWLGLLVVQPFLIGRGDVRLHRLLGRFGVLLAIGMAGLGIQVTMASIARGTVPFGFAPPMFLASNVMALASFAVMVVLAVILRKHTAWHRRLMISATVLLTAPAWARLLPLEQLGQATPLVLLAALSFFIIVGMARDRLAQGRIHPAWWIGLAVVVVNLVLPVPLAMTEAVVEFTARLTGA